MHSFCAAPFSFSTISMPRFFVPMPLTPGTSCVLPEAVARHIQVLRLHSGDPITLFNGVGGEYPATLGELGKKHALAQLDAFVARELETPYQLTLAQGIAGGDKMDWLIEKAVELGVARIAPLATVKSVVRLQGERAQKRRDHWQALTEAACEQCGRNRVPLVDPVSDLAGWLTGIGESDGLRLMLSPRGAQRFDTLPQAAPAVPVLILIGPEGGLSDSEEALAAAHGFTPLGLGTRILRTETAGIALLAALAARWGGW
jgi:16S rRNA (uracil1498-N3)-methyltransferase